MFPGFDSDLPLVPRSDSMFERTPIVEAWMGEWPRAIAYESSHAVRCAQRFLKERLPRHILSFAGELFSLQEDGTWSHLTHTSLESEIRNTDATSMLGAISNVIGAIHQLRLTAIAPGQWLLQNSSDPECDNIVLFANGRLDLTTMSFAEHDGRFFAVDVPSYPYDPAAKCPTWDQAVKDWLVFEDRRTLHEFLGYTMSYDTSLQKFLLLLGVPRSGKSTIMKIAELLVGETRTVARTLGDLSSRFGLDGVQGKGLLLIPDAHDVRANQHNAALNLIKSITGRDRMSIARKHKSFLDLELNCRIIMSANFHPKFLDPSAALAKREIVLTFQNSFSGREDAQLLDKLALELSGIANCAIDGLSRLRRQQKFTQGRLAHAAAERAAVEQAPASQFARDYLQVTGDERHFITDFELKFAMNKWKFQQGIRLDPFRSISDLKAQLLAVYPDKLFESQRRLPCFDLNRQRERESVAAYGLVGIKGRGCLHRGWLL